MCAWDIGLGAMCGDGGTMLCGDGGTVCGECGTEFIGELRWAARGCCCCCWFRWGCCCCCWPPPPPDMVGAPPGPEPGPGATVCGTMGRWPGMPGIPPIPGIRIPMPICCPIWFGLKAVGFGLRTLCRWMMGAAVGAPGPLEGSPPPPVCPGMPGDPLLASRGRLGCIEPIVGILEPIPGGIEVSCGGCGPPGRPGLSRCPGLPIPPPGPIPPPPPGWPGPQVPFGAPPDGLPLPMGMPIMPPIPCFMPPIIIMFGLMPAPPICVGIRIRSPIGA